MRRETGFDPPGRRTGKAAPIRIPLYSVCLTAPSREEGRSGCIGAAGLGADGRSARVYR